MKKLALSLLMLLVAFMPLMAVQDSHLEVAASVEGITEVGFTTQKYEDSSTSILAIGDEVKELDPEGGSASFFVAVRTNSKDAVTVLLTHTALVNTDNEFEAVTLKLDGQTYYEGLSSGLKIIEETGTEKGLRALSKEFTLTFSTAELAAATAGEYQAVVYMTVAGV